LYQNQYGRLRDVNQGPDGSLYILTNNTDGRGNPKPGDDRILKLSFQM
jgi:glucose/arabinose dehydrogenase